MTSLNHQESSKIVLRLKSHLENMSWSNLALKDYKVFCNASMSEAKAYFLGGTLLAIAPSFLILNKNQTFVF